MFILQIAIRNLYVEPKFSATTNAAGRTDETKRGRNYPKSWVVAPKMKKKAKKLRNRCLREGPPPRQRTKYNRKHSEFRTVKNLCVQQSEIRKSLASYLCTDEYIFYIIQYSAVFRFFSVVGFF